MEKQYIYTDFDLFLTKDIDNYPIGTHVYLLNIREDFITIYNPTKDYIKSITYTVIVMNEFITEAEIEQLKKDLDNNIKINNKDILTIDSSDAKSIQELLKERNNHLKLYKYYDTILENLPL